LRVKLIKVSTILGTKLSALNANISTLIKFTSNLQTNALKVFRREFARLSF